ncbi:hypothetical protein ACJX0J_016499, partial [Zea mays]
MSFNKKQLKCDHTFLINQNPTDVEVTDTLAQILHNRDKDCENEKLERRSIGAYDKLEIRDILKDNIGTWTNLLPISILVFLKRQNYIVYYHDYFIFFLLSIINLAGDRKDPT